MAKKENIAYLSDMQGVATTPDSAVQGNFPVFGPQHAFLDSGKKPSDFITQSGVDAAVATATAELWSVVTAAAALAAYQAPAWAVGTDYSVGSFCQYGGQGYRCTTAHTSAASFDATKWRLVLTAAGKTAITTVLAAYSKDGLAALIDLAPAYHGSRVYTIGMLAVKDGVLQICTKAGPGPLAEFARDATVEGALAVRLAQVVAQIPTKVSVLKNDTGFITKNDLPTKVSELQNDAHYVAGSVLDGEYDTTEHGYAVSDTCTHDAQFYVCVRAVAVGAEWNPEDWSVRTLKELVAAWSNTEQADWNETDATKPAFIKNKPTIPEPTPVDPTLSQEGQAADAKVVGQRFASILTLDKLPYQIVNVAQGTQIDPEVIEFNLTDRAVNCCVATVPNGVSIRLIPPAQPTSSTAGVVLARDFYVVLNLSSEMDVTVAVLRASIQDCFGQPVTPLKAPANGVAVFRLTDSDRSSLNSVFIISGFGDAAHRAARELEQALDDIIRDYGGGVFSPGVFLQDDVDPTRYHKLVIVTDDETGHKDLGVDQEGVIK